MLRAQCDDREALELLLGSVQPSLLGASVAALTFLIAWVTFAIILTITRTTQRILRAIEVSSASVSSF